MSDGEDRNEDEELSLLEKREEFFSSFFRKGAEFTRELLEDNDRLRRRVVQLESQLKHAREQEPSARTLQELVDKLHALEQERTELLARFADTETQESAFAERYAEIERENNNLASLYVAQTQLHSTLDVAEVVGVMVEIVLNFVGGRNFAIYLCDESGTLRPLEAHALNLADVPCFERGQGVIGAVAANGKTFTGEGPVPKGLRPGRDEPFVCLPLRAGGSIVGAIAIWGFLIQKESLVDVDQQIFDLLASSGGHALEAALLASCARRDGVAPVTGTFEACAELLR
jgi:hypothetical protein